MNTTTEPEIPPCLIRIDKEGRWYHQGVEMVRKDFIRMFYEHLQRDAQGRYIIVWEGRPCYLEVEDTAYVVMRVDPPESGGREDQEFRLALSDGSTEPLDPSTLQVGEGHVLYCMVKGGRFPARFLRPAYYQLASCLQEDAEGNIVLEVKGRRYPLTALAH